MIAETKSRSAPSQHAVLTGFAGGVAFLISFLALTTVLPIGGSPIVGAAIVAAVAMAITLLNLAGRMRRQNAQMSRALHGISLGLCVFDGNERLVYCNKRYADLYRLPDTLSRRGATLSDILAHRASNGSFMHDPSEFRRQLLDGVPIVRQEMPGLRR